MYVREQVPWRWALAGGDSSNLRWQSIGRSGCTRISAAGDRYDYGKHDKAGEHIEGVDFELM